MRELSPEQRELRDEIITRARYGDITPEIAALQAVAHNLPPFERMPDLGDFNAMRESRWTIVMALAWIAWRDINLVRQNCPGYASECTHWIFREWNEPVDGGTAFVRRAGWWLETWHEPTTARLSLLDIIRKGKGELPATTQMTVREAEDALWRGLSDGKLVAEALNEERRPTDIPAREWSYLKLFEDGKRDVLRYDALDGREPFSDVKLKRDDLLHFWPPVPVPAPEPERRAKLIARIEQRLETPALRHRTHCRVTEIVDDRVPDNNPQRRAEYFRAFELALKAGLFNDGKRQRSQLFWADAASQSFMRLTKDSLAMYLGDATAKNANASTARDAMLREWKMVAAEYRARRLESLASKTWMPRRFIGRWLTDYNLLPLPSWLGDTADQLQPVEDGTPAAVAPDAGMVEAAPPQPCWRIKDRERLTKSDYLVFETVKRLWPDSDYTGKNPQKRIADAIQQQVGAKFALSKTAINTARRKFYFGLPE